MKILLVTDAYPPEIRSAANLMAELAEELAERNHHVTVITSWPKYNLAEKTELSSIQAYQQQGNITIVRVKSLPHHKVNFIVRGIAQLTLPFLFKRQLKKYQLYQQDAVIVYTPPLPLARIGAWLKQQGARFILNVQDIFPQNAIDLNILTNTVLIRFFKRMEKKAYHAADVITAHSDGNKKLLTQSHPSIENKTVVLPNWVDLKPFQQLHNKKDFRHLFALNDKFVIIFAGVIGPSQALDRIVNAAHQLLHLPKLCFLFVGDGTSRQCLQQYVSKHNITNVLFRDFISAHDYPDLLKSCDVGLISLSPDNKTPVVPGKLLGYMAAGKPVLAFLNKESDGHVLIKQAQCGFSAYSDNEADIIRTIETCYYSSSLAKMGENGLIFAQTYLQKGTCVSQLEDLLRS